MVLNGVLRGQKSLGTLNAFNDHAGREAEGRGAGKGLEEGKGEGLAHLRLRDPLHTWPYEYFLSPAVDVLVMGFILSYHNVPREEYYKKMRFPVNMKSNRI